MKLITARDLIRRVADNWEQQYRASMDTRLHGGESKRDILNRLRALDPETATAADVTAIIGNPSWTELRCDECEAVSETVVEVGQPPDYERATARLCPACVAKARGLLP